MTEHTQLIDAVNIRAAVRTYDDEPIDDDTARQLEMALQPINLLGDLNIQLVRNQPKVFEANASGHLTNAANYLAIVGPKNDEEARERAGFYAERLVLTATLRGLGTLWGRRLMGQGRGRQALPCGIRSGALSRCGHRPSQEPSGVSGEIL